MKYTIIATQECNLDCTYCYEKVKENKSMKEENIPDIINFIKKHQEIGFRMHKKSIAIFFNGGEALLNFKVIKKFVSEFQKMGINTFNISTNLTVVDDEMLDYLYKNNFSLHISLDGSKEIHDKNRVYHNGKGSFDTVYNNILKIRRKYPDWNNSYNITFTPETVGHLYNGFMLLFNCGIRNITAAFCADYSWDEDALLTYKKEMEKIGNEYIKCFENGEKVYFKLLSDSIRYSINNQKAKCGGCIDEIAILPSGELLPCGVFTGQENYKDFVVGTVKDNIDKEKIIQLFVDNKIDNSDCKGCEFEARCHTECYAVNERVGGSLYSIPECGCAANQISLKLADKVIHTLYQKGNKLFLEEFKLIKKAVC